MGIRIEDIPLLLRPREKAIREGIESLSNVELLALIISSGSKNYSAIDIARELLNTYTSLSELRNISYSSLLNMAGLKKATALRLLACFTLFDRYYKEYFNNEIYVYDSKVLYQRYKFLENELQEHFILLLLNNQNKIIKEVKLYKGTSDKISINTKDILLEILTSKATKFAIVHNHPNDNEKASFDDKETTLKLIKLAKEFDVILYDHLIIYQGGYYSFLHKKT